MFGCDRMLSLWSHCGNPCKSAASEHDPCRTCLWQETTCALLITSESKTQLSTVPVLQSPSSVNNKYWLVLSHMRLSPALISYRDKTIKMTFGEKKLIFGTCPAGQSACAVTLPSRQNWEQWSVIIISEEMDCLQWHHSLAGTKPWRGKTRQYWKIWKSLNVLVIAPCQCIIPNFSFFIYFTWLSI